MNVKKIYWQGPVTFKGSVTQVWSLARTLAWRLPVRLNALRLHRWNYSNLKHNILCFLILFASCIGVEMTGIWERKMRGSRMVIPFHLSAVFISWTFWNSDDDFYIMFCMNDFIFLPWITSSERRLGPPIFFIGQTQDRKRKLVLEKQISKSPTVKTNTC